MAQLSEDQRARVFQSFAQEWRERSEAEFKKYEDVLELGLNPDVFASAHLALRVPLFRSVSFILEAFDAAMRYVVD